MELRTAIGNRIYGCDDCQLFCPWNKFARVDARAGLRACATGWTRRDSSSCSRGPKQELLARTEGSAIRRIGYEGWLRNIAVALGNAPTTPEVMQALAARRDDPSALVREHVQWALEQHTGTRGTEARFSATWDSSRRRAYLLLHVVDEPRLADTRRGQDHQSRRDCTLRLTSVRCASRIAK